MKNYQLKNYIGTKEVSAMPMTLGEFIGITKRDPYANDPNKHNSDESGYFVKYKDGYESWSPKGVFEEAYKCSDTHLDRMRIELDELIERLTKDINFYYSDKEHPFLSKSEAHLLGRQISVMREYADILLDRIKFAYGDNIIKVPELPDAGVDTNCKSPSL